MTRLIILTLILKVGLTFGQSKTVSKPFSDTIDYSAFSFKPDNEFYLYKVRQFKGQEIHDVKGRQLFFTIFATADLVNLQPQLKAKLSDTLVVLWWDLDTRDALKNGKKIHGVLRLDQQKNIMYITKEIEDPKTKTFKIIIKKFKVLKWTFSNIIFKDISNPEFDRTFYFRRPHL